MINFKLCSSNYVKYIPDSQFIIFILIISVTCLIKRLKLHYELFKQIVDRLKLFQS